MNSNDKIIKICGALFLLWAILTGAAIAWRFVFMWVSLRVLLHSLLAYGSGNLACSLELHARGGSRQGEFEITYVFANNGLLPIPWCQVTVHLEKELGSYGFKPETLNFFAGEIKSIRKEFCCTHRGIYEVGGATVLFQDLMGLKSKEISFQKHVTVEVFPRKYPIENLTTSGMKEGGHIRGSWNSEQDFTSISRIRQGYLQESSRHIHWKASARTDELLVREYETRKRPGVLILLDSGKEKFAQDSEGAIEERCVEVAAGLISHWLTKGYAVALKMGHDPILQLNGITSLDRALRALMVFRPHGESSTGVLFSNIQNIGLEGSLLQVISPGLSHAETLAFNRLQYLQILLFAVGPDLGTASERIKVVRVPV